MDQLGKKQEVLLSPSLTLHVMAAEKSRNDTFMLLRVSPGAKLGIFVKNVLVTLNRFVQILADETQAMKPSSYLGQMSQLFNRKPI